MQRLLKMPFKNYIYFKITSLPPSAQKEYNKNIIDFDWELNILKL